MNIIHVLPDINSTHTKHIISALKKWDKELVNGHKQVFLVYNGNKNIQDLENLIPYKYDIAFLFKIINYFTTSNKIIIHGGNYRLWVLLFFLPKAILKRINWICWGSQIDRGKKGCRSYIYYKIRYRVFKSFGAINFLIKDEINFFNENYSNKNKIYNPYFNLDFEKLKSLFPVKSIATHIQIKSVLIGNNAFYVNNHFEAIGYLKSINFKTDIYIIVSYGSKDLIESLNNTMEHYNLGKYKPIDKMLKIDDLLKLYSEIDAYIAYSETQTGLFAIYAFLYLMKPVYLKQGSLLEKFMTDHDFNYYCLNEISENELIQTSKLINNHDKIKKLINSEESFKKWNDFFLNNSF